MLLLTGAEPEPRLGPDVVQALAALGVTNVTVLCDERTIALALEGWAFDSNRSASAAARAVAAGPANVSILRPVLESAIHRLPASPTLQPDSP